MERVADLAVGQAGAVDIGADEKPLKATSSFVEPDCGVAQTGVSLTLVTRDREGLLEEQAALVGRADPDRVGALRLEVEAPRSPGAVAAMLKEALSVAPVPATSV